MLPRLWRIVRHPQRVGMLTFFGSLRFPPCLLEPASQCKVGRGVSGVGIDSVLELHQRFTRLATFQ
jgi:hypothetical protein